MADWIKQDMLKPDRASFYRPIFGAIGVYWGDDGGKLKFGLRCWGYLNPNYGFMEKLK